MLLDNTEALYEKIKILNEQLWESRANGPAVDRWLSNFTGQCKPKDMERRHALYLLSKFLYFGDIQVRQLLRAMFSDLVRHRLSVLVRGTLRDDGDFEGVHRGFLEELGKTRFLGLGDASESGGLILYLFRVANGMSKDYFANLNELITGPTTDPNTVWACPDIRRLVFVDDFCGTGNQAEEVAEKRIQPVLEVARHCNVDVEVWYLTLLATTAGIHNLRSKNLFDRVECVSELDSSYRAFGDYSQFYVNAPDGISKDDAEAIAMHYGKELQPFHPLGYANSQLLLGFNHNVPDNTLPIISMESQIPPMAPDFPACSKVLNRELSRMTTDHEMPIGVQEPQNPFEITKAVDFTDREIDDTWVDWPAPWGGSQRGWT